MKNKIKLFLVDDDALFLKSLEIEFLQHADFEIETYATGELCLANLSHTPDVIILDYHLDGIDKTAMNGMYTLDKIKNSNQEEDCGMGSPSFGGVWGGLTSFPYTNSIPFPFFCNGKW